MSIFCFLVAFLSILDNFDFRNFPILCDLMSFLWFSMTFCPFEKILIFGGFQFYVIVCPFFDFEWLFVHFRKFWFSDFSHFMWFYVLFLIVNDFLSVLENFDFGFFPFYVIWCPCFDF
jgi:hypothetical protein